MGDDISRRVFVTGVLAGLAGCSTGSSGDNPVSTATATEEEETHTDTSTGTGTSEGTESSTPTPEFSNDTVSLAEDIDVSRQTAAYLNNVYTPKTGLGVSGASLDTEEDVILQMDASQYFDSFTGYFDTPSFRNMQAMARDLTAIYQHDLNRDTVFAFAGMTAHRGTPSGRLYVADETGNFTVLTTEEDRLRNGNGEIVLEESDIGSSEEIARFLNGDNETRFSFDKSEQDIASSFELSRDGKGDIIPHTAYEHADAQTHFMEEAPKAEVRIGHSIYAASVPSIDTEIRSTEDEIIVNGEDNLLMTKNGLRVLDHKLVPETRDGRATVNDGLAYMRIADLANEQVDRNLYKTGLRPGEYVEVGSADSGYEEFDVRVRADRDTRSFGEFPEEIS